MGSPTTESLVTHSSHYIYISNIKNNNSLRQTPPPKRAVANASPNLNAAPNTDQTRVLPRRHTDEGGIRAGGEACNGTCLMCNHAAPGTEPWLCNPQYSESYARPASTGSLSERVAPHQGDQGAHDLRLPTLLASRRETRPAPTRSTSAACRRTPRHHHQAHHRHIVIVVAIAVRFAHSPHHRRRLPQHRHPSPLPQT